MRAATRAVMAQFFVNGAAFAAWGVQIPDIKSRFGLSDFVLSFAMLVVAGGAIVAMGTIGRWATRVGSARALTISGVAYAVAVGLVPLMPGYAVLLGLLLVLGMAMAGFDVTMNVQAAAVEAQGGRPIMSTLHGMFSVGGMAGAGLGGLAALAALPPWVYPAGIALMALAAIAIGRPHLIDDAPGRRDATARENAPAQDDAASGKRRQASAALWVLGFFAFLGLICEGAMYDWASVYLRDVTHAAPQLASYGYAAFSTGMACGRFAADPLRRRIGDSRTLAASAWMGFAGITLAVCLPEPAWTLAGLLLMGLGVANLMPFFFLAGARLPGLRPAQGVAAIARWAYTGMLLGPAIIGGITHHANLRVALMIVAAIMGLIAAVGIRQVSRIGR
ncbi:amino acid ABC transporter permease [Bordetella sp. H567]|nr:amino acid ABC transporter permease [Bordetella sp. H567]